MAKEINGRSPFLRMRLRRLHPFALTMGLSFLATVTQSSYGQFPSQPAGPAAAPMHPAPVQPAAHAEPAIYRPPTRAAGAANQPASQVNPAAWSQPIESPIHHAVTSSEDNKQRSMPLWSARTEDKAKLKQPSSPWASTISMIVSLSLVLAVFFAFAWFARKFVRQPMSRGLSKDVVQVVGRTPLAPRHQMILIRFGRKLVLVSQQMGQTQTLSEIEDPREVDYLLGLCEQQAASSISTSFRDVLHQFANGKNERNPETAKGFSA